jgi:hypothetical protein
MRQLACIATLSLLLSALTFAAPSSQMVANLPVTFEPNLGQTDAQVRYLARGSGYVAYITDQGTVLSLDSQQGKRAVLQLTLQGGRAVPSGMKALPSHSNYFLRDHSITGVPNFAAVESQDVWPGIDLVYHADRQRMEYDFRISPGTKVDRARVVIGGAESLTIAGNGDLVVHTAAGDLVQHRPIAYQISPSGQRTNVAVAYLVDGNVFGFKVGDYDHTRSLIIDPTLSYSTYLGGNSADEAFSVAVDSTGHAYVTGSSESTNFPLKGGLGFTHSNGCPTTFVTKFAPDGKSLVYSTYLGNGCFNTGSAIAVDRFGNAYVVGTTQDQNFPANEIGPQSPNGNAFAAKINPAGNVLVYAVKFGGSSLNSATAKALAIDSSGNAYITGFTGSADFPVTPKAFMRTYPSGASEVAFVAKLNFSGTAFVYASFYGAHHQTVGNGIGIDGSGNAYITGFTNTTVPTTAASLMPNKPAKTCPERPGPCQGRSAFAAKFNSTGSALVYATYLAGNGDDVGNGIAVASGFAYVTGQTFSTNFPTTAGAFRRTAPGNGDAFVTKLNPSGASLAYSTYLGGQATDEGRSIAVNSSGQAHVTGATTAKTFPVKNAFQSTFGGTQDGFLTKFAADGRSLLYSTYFGGDRQDAANSVRLDGAGNAYVVGSTSSANFPTTAGAFQRTQGGSLVTNSWLAKVIP